jgi:hypothetical protein
MANVGNELSPVFLPDKKALVLASSPPGKPNPSFEPTHTGKRQLAYISFWANRRLPVWAAQLKR